MKDKIDEYFNRLPEEYTISFYSSSVFITNAIHALVMNNIVYSCLFTGLFISSVVIRMYPNIYTTSLDNIAIGLVVLYGGKLFLDKVNSGGIFKNILLIGLIILTFLLTIFLYSYGYMVGSYCFGENGYTWNALMHCISSVGHHLILLL
jgi:hypothetical protein